MAKQEQDQGFFILEPWYQYRTKKENGKTVKVLGADGEPIVENEGLKYIEGSDAEIDAAIALSKEAHKAKQAQDVIVADLIAARAKLPAGSLKIMFTRWGDVNVNPNTATVKPAKAVKAVNAATALQAAISKAKAA